MSYMMDTTLKMTSKEYNKFKQFVNNYVEQNDKIGYVPKEEIESDDVINYLYDYEWMDGDLMCIAGMYKASSIEYEIIEAYIKDVNKRIDEDETIEDEFSYVEYGESIFEDIMYMGNCDFQPEIDLRIDPNLSMNAKDVKDKLKIIIE